MYSNMKQIKKNRKEPSNNIRYEKYSSDKEHNV